MDIGKELQSLRKKNGLTQAELAEKCNLSKNAIWNYENNKRTPSITTIKKISEVLGVDLGYLITTVPSLNLDEEDLLKLKSLGIGSKVDLVDFDSMHLSLPKFVEFLAASSFPCDLGDQEIQSLYKKTIDFLEYEFYKLGYIKFSKRESNE